MSQTTSLPSQELETAYENIAAAIDALPEEQERLFLAKLCLALAHRVTDAGQVQQALEEAARDLGTDKR